MTKQALLKVIEGTPAERKFLCEQSFLLFAIYYFKEYFKYPLADYHKEFAQDCHDLVNGDIREVAWIAFRESAKTTFAKLFVIWLVAYNKRKYINLDSYDKENAERILFDVAFELVNNARLRADFGVLFSKQRGIDDVKQNRINNFITENGIRVEAHSTQESVRGRIHLNQRPDALICDDIETNKTKDSPAYTKAVRDHITEALAGIAPEGFILYLGNYISEAGNIQWLMDRAITDHKLRIRNIPVIIDGKPAWEAKYALTDDEAKATGKVSIEDKQRQLGSQVFSYEMMNQPIDDSIAEFKREFIQKAELKDIQHLSYNTFVTIDTAVSEKTSADNTGITINRVTKENKWYITAYKLKVNPKGLIDHIFYVWETYRPITIGIEKTTYLLAVKPFLDDEMRKRNVFIHITELDHKQTAKETRIRALIPRWESKSIFFVGNCDDLEQEMRVFPRGQHDDTLDSCFVAGTPVLTKDGYVPIEKIKTNDLVVTRNGLRRVKHAWCSGYKEVITKYGITGTPNHPFITTKGVVPFINVNESDILYTWNEENQTVEKQSLSTATDTTGIRTHLVDNTRRISGHISKTNNLLLRFIEKFGDTTLARFLLGIISTTKTVTRSITQSRTSKCCQSQNTRNFTLGKKNAGTQQENEQYEILNHSKTKQRNGEKHKTERNGTDSMRSNLSLENQEKKCVLCVQKNTRQESKSKQSSVLENAIQSTTRVFLEQNTRCITRKERSVVFNIEVEKDNEYFVNGILVHNCAYQEQIAYAPNNIEDLSALFDDDSPYKDIGL